MLERAREELSEGGCWRMNCRSRARAREELSEGGCWRMNSRSRAGVVAGERA